MERLPFTTGGRRHGDAAISDVANVQNEVAWLFERFRLDLERMFNRSTPNDAFGHDVTHLVTHRTRAR